MRVFYSDHAIIGSNLKLKEKVYVYVSDEGYVVRISDKRPKNSIDYEFFDALLVPGFINLHTHIGDSFAKDEVYGLNTVEAVGSDKGLKWKLLEEVDEERFKNGVRMAVKEILSTGTTTFVDFREGGVEGIKKLREALNGVRIRNIILGYPSDNKIYELLKISDGIGIHSLNAHTDLELKEIFSTARSMNKLIAFHASETVYQREKSFRRYGVSDVIRGLNLIRPDFIVHMTRAELHEIKRVADERIPVVLCPRANMYLSSGIPPIKEFVRNNVIIGLGTDNVMVSSPDLFRELECVVRLTRLEGLKIDPKDLLKMVTKNATNILNRPIGIIEEGFHADFFVFDLSKPNVAGMEDLLKALVLRGKSENVLATFVNGKIAFER